MTESDAERETEIKQAFGLCFIDIIIAARYHFECERRDRNDYTETPGPKNGTKHLNEVIKIKRQPAKALCNGRMCNYTEIHDAAEKRQHQNTA